jgi:hypothetical protein
MSAGNFTGDIKAKSKPLLAWAGSHTKEGLEQALERGRCDRIALIRNR